MKPRVIHHFGPDPAYVGGMGSVIRVLTTHRVGGDVVELHPTWRPEAMLDTFRLTLVAASKILQMPRHQVVHIHLSERGSFIREGALVILSGSRGLTTVVTIHGASFLAFANRHPWLVSMVLKRAKLITCLDRDVFDFVRQAAPKTMVEVLPNPVSMDEGSCSADKTDEIVLFAGEIGLRKGADVLHRAWRIVAEQRPRARCIMVGPVNDFAVPEAERLEVRGPVDADGMRDLLRVARVVVLPSRAEGMPMILTEAMGGGRPFVSTPVGGIPELAQGGGILVAVGDENELAVRLVELLADPVLARSVGERGRQFCQETRSVEAIDGRLRQLYTAAAQV